jgi:hypothetical protein
MTSYEQEFAEDVMDQTILGSIRSRNKIEEYMTNKDRSKFSYIFDHTIITLNIELIQWAPSRDWSRLFVLSTIPHERYDDEARLHLEFYDFNT